MAIEIRTPTEDDAPALFELDGRAFANVWDDQLRAAFSPCWDLDRFRIAVERGEVVATAGSFAQELTVPGGRQIRAGGVTWVAVSTSHRRQGLLRRLLEEVHHDIAERDEPVAQLTASEGGIYERFGYGLATRTRVVEVDRRRTQIAPRFAPAGRPGGPDMRIVDPTKHVDDLVAIFDRYRLGRVGEIQRDADWTRLRLHESGKDVTAALHPDGFATWTVKDEWNDGHPAFPMRLVDLVAVTPEAHVALWNTVLSTDLVGPIRSWLAVPLDDPLPLLLTDQRALRTTDLNDMLWVRPGDIARSFGARTYATDDAFVVEVSEGDTARRWRIDGSPEGASVRKVRTKPQLSTDRATLGALLLGGVLPTTLAAGRRLTASSADVLRRADHFFGHLPSAHCSTGF